MKFAIAILFAAAAFGQPYEREQWEIGADIGYGFYRDGTIFSSTETLQAGIRNRFAAGLLLGDEFSPYVSVELRYLYQDGHPFLQGEGVKSDIQGNSDSATYNVLFHFARRERPLRPFVEGGIGAKGYIIAGPAPFPQPIPAVASLTTNDVWKLVFTAGGGVSYRVMRHMQVRAEFVDYMTTFPRQEIVPAPHNTARGIFQQFTPLFAASYAF